MRRLVHIPIVHSDADLGSAAAAVRQAYVENKGEAAWKESRQAVARFWHAVETAVERIGADAANLRLYQDGLPVCGFEDRIVRDLARHGGANYRILAKLAARGAKLEGTEDPDLLRREYELIMARTAAGGVEKDRSAGHLRELLEHRDRFIAQRIDRTLREGETGLLFLGALHHAAEQLPATIAVVSLSDFLRSPAAGP